jgi:hypothetical protein
MLGRFEYKPRYQPEAPARVTAQASVTCTHPRWRFGLVSNVPAGNDSSRDALPMNRACLSIVAALMLLSALGVRAAEPSPLDASVMKVALHTAQPEEDGFIEYVLARVDKGTLPLDLVESTFLWARKKPRHKFQYFKAGLIQRAAAAGITL